MTLRNTKNLTIRVAKRSRSSLRGFLITVAFICLSLLSGICDAKFDTMLQARQDRISGFVASDTALGEEFEITVDLRGKYTWLTDVEGADILSDKGQYVEAEQGYIRALTTRGGLSYSHQRAILFSLARVQLASGKLERAKGTLEEVVELANGEISMLVELYNGMLASADGRLMDAIESYERALLIDNQHHDVIANLARASLVIGRLEDWDHFSRQLLRLRRHRRIRLGLSSDDSNSSPESGSDTGTDMHTDTDTNSEPTGCALNDRDTCASATDPAPKTTKLKKPYNTDKDETRFEFEVGGMNVAHWLVDEAVSAFDATKTLSQLDLVLFDDGDGDIHDVDTNGSIPDNSAGEQGDSTGNKKNRVSLMLKKAKDDAMYFDSRLAAALEMQDYPQVWGQVHFNIAQVLERMGVSTFAMWHFEQSTRIAPVHAGGHLRSLLHFPRSFESIHHVNEATNDYINKLSNALRTEEVSTELCESELATGLRFSMSNIVGHVNGNQLNKIVSLVFAFVGHVCYAPLGLDFENREETGARRRRGVGEPRKLLSYTSGLSRIAETRTSEKKKNNNSNRKLIRVGVVSGRFNNSTTGRLLVPLLEGLDPHEFDIHLFGWQQRNNDDISSRLQKRAGRANVYNLDVHRIVDARLKVESANLDVLMFADSARSLHFATHSLAYSRLAPIQISFHGLSPVPPLTSPVSEKTVVFDYSLYLLGGGVPGKNMSGCYKSDGSLGCDNSGKTNNNVPAEIETDSFVPGNGDPVSDEHDVRPQIVTLGHGEDPNTETGASGVVHTGRICLAELPVPALLTGGAVPLMAVDGLQFFDDTNYYLVVERVQMIHPEFDAVVVGLLERDPHARVLFLVSRYEQQWNRVFQRRLVSAVTDPEHAKRIHLLQRLPHPLFANLLQLVDVVLDTFPSHGGVPLLEALWLLTPVVTMASNSPSSVRNDAGQGSGVGVSACDSLGVSEWCVGVSVGDVVEKAFHLANDANLRMHVRKTIKEHRHALFDLDTSFEFGKEEEEKNGIPRKVCPTASALFAALLRHAVAGEAAA